MGEQAVHGALDLPPAAGPFVEAETTAVAPYRVSDHRAVTLGDGELYELQVRDHVPPASRRVRQDVGTRGRRILAAVAGALDAALPQHVLQGRQEVFDH